MDLLSAQGILAFVQIMLIDILLAGDNAIVIGMAAQKLPELLRKKAIFWGTFGAIGIRLAMAFLFVEAINNIPALRLVGGILLLWIGYKLLVGEEQEHTIEAKDNLRGAITTIVIADGIMGIDNVLGVIGAAQGNMTLVVTGMLITVPIIVWGSSIFIRLVEKYPIILLLGGAVLGWAGAGMIGHDPIVAKYLAPYQTILGIACMGLVVGAALLAKRIKRK